MSDANVWCLAAFFQAAVHRTPDAVLTEECRRLAADNARLVALLGQTKVCPVLYCCVVLLYCCGVLCGVMRCPCDGTGSWMGVCADSTLLALRRLEPLRDSARAGARADACAHNCAAQLH